MKRLMCGYDDWWEIRSRIQAQENLWIKAAYGIQGKFAVLIQWGIEGDYNNVVGLPVAGLYMSLKHFKEKTYD